MVVLIVVVVVVDQDLFLDVNCAAARDERLGGEDKRWAGPSRGVHLQAILKGHRRAHGERIAATARALVARGEVCEASRVSPIISSEWVPGVWPLREHQRRLVALHSAERLELLWGVAEKVGLVLRLFLLLRGLFRRSGHLRFGIMERGSAIRGHVRNVLVHLRRLERRFLAG